MKHKYKLKLIDRLTLPLLWIWWKLSIAENKKATWHEVVSGIEIHEHKFRIPYYEQGFKFLQCDHYGCTLCIPEKEGLALDKFDALIDQHRQARILNARERMKSAIHECSFCHKDFIGYDSDDQHELKMICTCVHCGSVNSYQYYKPKKL